MVKVFCFAESFLFFLGRQTDRQATRENALLNASLFSNTYAHLSSVVLSKPESKRKDH